MSVIDQIKEATEELAQTLEESGAKDKAKSASITLFQVVGEGLIELESAMTRGFKSLEQKYEDNLKKIQAEKTETTLDSEKEVETLKQLRQLYDANVLTEEEFTQAKQRVLDRL